MARIVPVEQREGSEDELFRWSLHFRSQRQCGGRWHFEGSPGRRVGSPGQPDWAFPHRGLALGRLRRTICARGSHCTLGANGAGGTANGAVSRGLASPDCVRCFHSLLTASGA